MLLCHVVKCTCQNFLIDIYVSFSSVHLSLLAGAGLKSKTWISQIHWYNKNWKLCQSFPTTPASWFVADLMSIWPISVPESGIDVGHIVIKNPCWHANLSCFLSPTTDGYILTGSGRQRDFGYLLQFKTWYHHCFTYRVDGSLRLPNADVCYDYSAKNWRSLAAIQGATFKVLDLRSFCAALGYSARLQGLVKDVKVGSIRKMLL